MMGGFIFVNSFYSENIFIKSFWRALNHLLLLLTLCTNVCLRYFLLVSVLSNGCQGNSNLGVVYDIFEEEVSNSFIFYTVQTTCSFFEGLIACSFAVWNEWARVSLRAWQEGPGSQDIVGSVFVCPNWLNCYQLSAVCLANIVTLMDSPGETLGNSFHFPKQCSWIQFCIALYRMGAVYVCTYVCM